MSASDVSLSSAPGRCFWPVVSLISSSIKAETSGAQWPSSTYGAAGASCM
eukprot:CAMPEP_0197663582 /NCGR_PEP_ID=MMETSP1338-20131121/57982_1 /TAXON_ID=43686 ORGANISM="Pelagodinium beii, Strain RCC1491" /NCGR_SAMPLE_ID=MMETSP1338 /ASSEMBLY_ACC=CAM_ASM_000754 /LENGTH=49 /DNA_ID=CAMNT_0043242025 /DNA_START=366 /DNA_END=515 /DNA_ORIENTATION=+